MSPETPQPPAGYTAEIDAYLHGIHRCGASVFVRVQMLAEVFPRVNESAARVFLAYWLSANNQLDLLRITPNLVDTLPALWIEVSAPGATVPTMRRLDYRTITEAEIARLMTLCNEALAYQVAVRGSANIMAALRLLNDVPAPSEAA